MKTGKILKYAGILVGVLAAIRLVYVASATILNSYIA